MYFPIKYTVGNKIYHNEVSHFWSSNCENGCKLLEMMVDSSHRQKRLRARQQELWLSSEGTFGGNSPDCWPIDQCSLRTFENRVRPTLQSQGLSIDPKNSGVDLPHSHHGATVCQSINRLFGARGSSELLRATRSPWPSAAQSPVCIEELSRPTP